ncbi:cache domain-containing sensor histidine kinase [Paenibacillus sp. SYP-B4298]|uniref:cache domain-containing sensor histidine kinase n=1 Tax=Paenibacillus sp. SYP-B4298 TaxID=2996034 RepID=UPI0022DE55AE|nr:sensor histidine kinase [Paenibacillus sp. SYP-B4298]
MIQAIMQSIRKKMILSFVGVIMLPLLLSIYISYRNFAAELEQSYIVNNKAILQQLISRLDDYFIQLENVGLAFYSDLLFSPEYQLADTEFIQHNLKLRKLMSLYLARKETHSVLFYTPLNQELYVINKALNTSFSDAKAMEERDWYAHAVAEPDKLIIEPQHKLSNYPAEYRIQSGVPVFSLTRLIKGYTPEVGVLTMNYTLTQLQRIGEEGLLSPDEEIGVWTAKGELLYSSDPAMSSLPAEWLSTMAGEEEAGSFQYTEAGSAETKRLVYARSAHNGQLVAKLIPVHVIIAQADKTRTINLLIALSIVCIVIATTAYISIRLTGPLLKLKRHMVRAGEGNFQLPVTVTQTDEIGQISHAYNRMIQQIDTLITEKYKMRLATRESQWKALQAQINPHFMYNTLQTIGSVALDEGIDELVRMTHALSDMLRYSLKPGERAMLQDELRNVEDYLWIQTCRFEDRLASRIDVPKEALQWVVPKLFLQPLVENAIIHGLEPSKHRGEVELQCRLEDGGLRIIITDNGVGIAPERLSRLQAALDAPDMLEQSGHERIGLLNVSQRLQLMYGQEARLQLSSAPGQGTQVELWLPPLPEQAEPHEQERGKTDEI